jgi:ABC-2 type transport system ATP-binding protein
MNIVEVASLTKQIGQKAVLHDISFSAANGDFVGIIGPNGAGKTTLLRCITGQIPVRQGSVVVAGHDVGTNSLAAKGVIGYALDPALLPEQLTGLQFARLIAAGRHFSLNLDELRHLSEMLFMAELLTTEIGAYSQGMKQKLSIICALLGNPQLVVLDESLNGLDPVSSYKLKSYLRDAATGGRVTILHSTHMIESLEKYCTRVILLHEGRICRSWLRRELVEEKEQSHKDLEQLFVDALGIEREPVRTIAVHTSGDDRP